MAPDLGLHAGQDRPGRVDVGHPVHPPAQLPGVVVAEPAAGGDAGVGAVDVDGTELGLDPLDHRSTGRAVTDVSAQPDGPGQPAAAASAPPASRSTTATLPPRCQRRREGPADAAGPARHDRHGTLAVATRRVTAGALRSPR